MALSLGDDTSIRSFSRSSRVLRADPTALQPPKHVEYLWMPKKSTMIDWASLILRTKYPGKRQTPEEFLQEMFADAPNQSGDEGIPSKFMNMWDRMIEDESSEILQDPELKIRYPDVYALASDSTYKDYTRRKGYTKNFVFKNMFPTTVYIISTKLPDCIFASDFFNQSTNTWDEQLDAIKNYLLR